MKITFKHIYVILIGLMLNSVISCSLPVTNITSNLQLAIKNNNDIEKVYIALPSYILLMESMIIQDSDDEELLKAYSQLLSAYGSLEETRILRSQEHEDRMIIKERLIIRSQSSLQAAQDAICIWDAKYCDITDKSYQQVEFLIQDADESDTEYLTALAQAWATWIRLNTENWAEIAKIAQLKLLLNFLLTSENINNQIVANIYLGVLNSLIPESMGGTPEKGKQYFENALSLTEGKSAMVNVLYAEYYARLVYDEMLHDKLLKQAIEMENDQSEYRLMNVIAKEKAKWLMKTKRDYF